MLVYVLLFLLFHGTVCSSVGCSPFDTFLLAAGIVVGLSWSAFNVSEESGSVTVCIELLEGLLETEVSVLLETEQSDSGECLH